MMESIKAKIGMSLEEYAKRVREYYKNREITEDDNPIPGIPDMSILTWEEIRFATDYITANGL